MRVQQRLFARYIKDIPAGTLTWIGLRPERKADILEINECMALKGMGLEGDHRSTKTPNSGRQVTLISEEWISQIAHHTGNDFIHPSLLRRNLVVKDINLNAIRQQQFQIGDAIFEAGAHCHPCSRMETALGKGGLVAMLGYGGLCCKILQSGKLSIGDDIRLLTPQTELF